MVYGLWRMCQAIPAPGQDPPDGAPISEIPGIGPPSWMHKLPPLWLPNQLPSSRVSLQHRDRNGGWQTDYTFARTTSQIGGVAMVAYDANGIALATNDVAVVTVNGSLYAPMLFTNLPPVPDTGLARMFRLVGE
jgi:hypothetical protein